MRLTEKGEFGNYVGSNLLDDECLCRGLDFEELNEMTKTFNKLGQLEDIEEDLGIDLVTLFKALKNGCYIKSKNGEIVFYGGNELAATSDSLEIYIGIDEEWIYIPYKDYGKTWALTKEELE